MTILISTAHLSMTPDMNDLPQTCELCGGGTPASYLVDEWYPHAQKVSKAKRCFECWHLEDAIHRNPERAAQILVELKR